MFHGFCLENFVPRDLLRKIDPYLDSSELRETLSRFYSHTGRPSIDPEVVLRLLIVGSSNHPQRVNRPQARKSVSAHRSLL